jgi:hypothetical protein
LKPHQLVIANHVAIEIILTNNKKNIQATTKNFAGNNQIFWARK